MTELQRESIQASEEEESRLLSDERKRLDELERAKAIAEAERDAAETARTNGASAARRVVRTTMAGSIVALVLFVAASGAGWLAYQKAQEERLAAERADQAATRAEREAACAASAAANADAQRDAALLIQSRFLTWSFWDRTVRIGSSEPRPRSLLRLEGGDAETVQELSSGAIAVHTNTGSVVLYSADLEAGPSLRNDARDVIGLIDMSDGRLLTQGSNDGNREPGMAPLR